MGMQESPRTRGGSVKTGFAPDRGPRNRPPQMFLLCILSSDTMDFSANSDTIDGGTVLLMLSSLALILTCSMLAVISWQPRLSSATIASRAAHSFSAAFDSDELLLSWLRVAVNSSMALDWALTAVVLARRLSPYIDNFSSISLCREWIMSRHWGHVTQHQPMAFAIRGSVLPGSCLIWRVAKSPCGRPSTTTLIVYRWYRVHNPL
mmetsp:Transcript_91027/g.281524  ORF Transcript_91027/g.281524 Transcript_91027/m.281524 type:complete len:206 (-) Transcript_91027:504-1121(-)